MPQIPCLGEGGLLLLKDLRNEQQLAGPTRPWKLSLDSASVRTWACPGPLSRCVLHGSFWHCQAQSQFFRIISVSWPPGLLGLDQALCWPCPGTPAPGVGLSLLSRASACTGKLWVPPPSWVTAPVACVETLRPSHLPVPSVHVGIVSSRCH